MPRARHLESTLSILSHSSQRLYVCTACRAQVIRQLHTTPRSHAEQPFLERIKNSLFGSKASKEQEQKSKEAQAKELTKAAAVYDGTGFRMKKRNGVKYQIAPVIDPNATNVDYTPATTWDGLEHIGGDKHAKRAQDKGEVYKGFMPSKRIHLSDAHLSNLIHHITVEALVLQKAGRDLNQLCYPRGKAPKAWQHTNNAHIEADENGNASLLFYAEDAERVILRAIPGQRPKRLEQEAGSENVLTKDELASLLEGVPAPGMEVAGLWRHTMLSDPNVKFAIIKRLLQLTGARPSDFLLSSATTLEGLYQAFKIKEKPKKLAHSEQLQSMNVDVPNITVYARRRTMVDKEKAVGRWKVIEEELIKRDLPVTGSRWRDAKPSVTAEWVR